jgi:hypothetical protein
MIILIFIFIIGGIYDHGIVKYNDNFIENGGYTLSYRIN